MAGATMNSVGAWRSLWVASIALLSTGAGAATWVVTDTGDATSNLVCDAQCTLREAIAAAQDGDTITWSSALTFPATTLLVAGSGGLTIDKNLTLLGPGAHQLTVDAQHLSRVLTITPPASAVTIDGLAIARGRVQGATGGQECVEDPYLGYVCGNGLPGESTAGGCVHSTISQLSLSGVDIHDCALVSGRGGHGAYLLHSDFSVGRGFNGGPGGNAVGGAIYATGALVMVDSAVHAVHAEAGGGGNGGPSYYSDLYPSPPGPPGNGASGGNVYGAVLHSADGAQLTNVSLIADMAVSGFGGYGGILYSIEQTPISVADGGHGGWIVGGIWLWQGSSKASFSTFHAGDYDLGARGQAGATSDGVLAGRFVKANDGSSPLVVHKSVFSAAPPSDPIAPATYCDGSAITTVNSIAEHACASAVVTAAALAAKTTGALGITTLPPRSASSPIVDAASDCLDVDGQAVSHDANGEPRAQIGACDLGAHELPNAVFAHGFE